MLTKIYLICFFYVCFYLVDIGKQSKAFRNYIIFDLLLQAFSVFVIKYFFPLFFFFNWDLASVNGFSVRITNPDKDLYALCLRLFVYVYCSGQMTVSIIAEAYG